MRGESYPSLDWNSLFTYDISGKIYRREKLSNNCDITLPAGKLHKATGYMRVAVGNRRYREHRIIWEMHNGAIPEGYEVDHINHVRSDNRIENLRLVKRQQNNQNMSLRRNSTSGYIGVTWDKQTNKWRSVIHVNGKNIHLGRFSNLEDAVEARRAAEVEYGFHPNHGK